MRRRGARRRLAPPEDGQRGARRGRLLAAGERGPDEEVELAVEGPGRRPAARALGLVLLLERVDAVLALDVGARRAAARRGPRAGVDGVGDLPPLRLAEAPAVEIEVARAPGVDERGRLALAPAILPVRQVRVRRRQLPVHGSSQISLRLTSHDDDDDLAFSLSRLRVETDERTDGRVDRCGGGGGGDEAGVGNKRREGGGRAARGREERRPVGRDDRDAARGGAAQMHGAVVWASGRRWIGPSVGGADGFDRDTEPARD